VFFIEYNFCPFSAECRLLPVILMSVFLISHSAECHSDYCLSDEYHFVYCHSGECFSAKSFC
jgi:hypothetical protein